ncbi:MAG: protein translocase subunit SecF [Clostridiales bacterium]
MNFTGRRKIWYIISLLIIIPGIISLMLQGFNKGIDFTGGSIIQIQFTKTVGMEQLREVLDKNMEQSSSIQSSGDNEYLIRTTHMEESESNAIIQSLKDELGELSVLRNDLIGPIMGKELLRNAQLAIVMALIFMLIYVSFRFKFNFAVSAVVALAHDVLVMISVFSLLQIEIDSTFVAAILTILGYSINNTIVVFDRVRENIALPRYKKESFAKIIDDSINQTLTRSINTVVAVLLLLLSLMFLGGETTQFFAFAIVIGIIAGSYSSIFLAGSFLLDITNFRSRPKKIAKDTK